MFKATDYIVFAFILLLITLGVMNVGVNVLTNKNIKLTNDSRAYIETYTGLTTNTMNVSSLQESVNGKPSNLTESEVSNSYAQEYLDTLKQKNKLILTFDLVKNAPTFFLLALGLPIQDYSIYINIIGWFFGAALIIVGIGVIQGIF